MGSFAKGSTYVEEYSVPKEAEKVFREGILNNPLVSKDLPASFEKYAEKIKFQGSDFPSIPINWRFAESISALKGLEAVFLSALLEKKYALPPQEIVIDIDHATLFIMSSLLWTIDPEGEKIRGSVFGDPVGKAKFDRLFRDCDIYKSQGTIHNTSTTNIYKTKDNRHFHLHGSLNPGPSQESLGIPHDSSTATFEDGLVLYVKAMSEIDSAEMQKRATEIFKQAGTICYTIEEYKQSEHGKANSQVGLYEIYSKPNSVQPATWWPSSLKPALQDLWLV